jgi:hypothetical protein
MDDFYDISFNYRRKSCDNKTLLKTKFIALYKGSFKKKIVLAPNASEILP